jgi:putative phosphoribosyl transferase
MMTLGTEGRFRDRYDAGHRLAERLPALRNRPDTLVLALPPGGVPVGHELARSIGAPLDVIVVRRLTLPSRPALTLGAVCSAGARVLNEELINALELPQSMINEVADREHVELEQQVLRYRGHLAAPLISDRIVIVVDDGLAAASSAAVALRAVRRLNPKELILAVPVAPPSIIGLLSDLADRVLCLMAPDPFIGVGSWYRTFDVVGEDDIKNLLSSANRRITGADAAPA